MEDGCYCALFVMLKKELYELRLLFKSVPSVVFTLFSVSVVAMNLLANKSIALSFSFLALDCGIIVSWVAFLCMDILTKHFGPKAATQISLVAVGINLLACFVFYLASAIPGIWAQSYVDGSEGVINTALDAMFAGTWYVLAGSTLAFIISAFVNNFLNHAVGKVFKKNPDGFSAYISRSYISTAIGQFCDNMVFALTVSHVFFGWTLLQCVMCSVTGMVVELLCEAVFSFFGYKICLKWKNEKIGEEYLHYIEGKK